MWGLFTTEYMIYNLDKSTMNIHSTWSSTVCAYTCTANRAEYVRGINAWLSGYYINNTHHVD